MTKAATTTKKKIGKEKRFLTALESGKTYSRKQAMARFKLGNPSATIHRIATDGVHSVHRQYQTKKVKGVYITTVKYAL